MSIRHVHITEPCPELVNLRCQVAELTNSSDDLRSILKNRE
jgi:hypothetical protein